MNQTTANTGELLHSLFEATATETGEGFFRALVHHLAKSLDARYVFASEILKGGRRAQTLAHWWAGRFIENIEYSVTGTPCEKVLSGEIVQIGDSLDEFFPEDPQLREKRFRSYLGIPLVGRTGQILGHVAALDTRPMEEKAHDFSALEVFAARATAELERRRADHALRHRVDIEKLVASISTSFIHVETSKISRVIDQAVERIGGFMAADRSWIVTLSPDEDKIEHAYEWCLEGIGSTDREPDTEKLKHHQSLRELILESDVTHWTDVQAIPDSDVKSWLRSRDVKSLICVPLRYGETWLGTLGFESVSDEKIWENDDVRLLRLAGEVFVNAIERRKADEALRRTQARLLQSEKLAALGQLTAGIAHELNTPVGVIRSNADIASRALKQLSSPLADNGVPNGTLKILQASLGVSSDASRRIDELVNSLKRYTRLDEADIQETDLHDSLESALDILRPFLKEGVEVVRNYGELEKIRSTPSGLNQLFMTLLKNANEAIEKGGTIRISTRTDEDQAVVCIADNGRGIKKDQMDRIFEVGFGEKGSRMGMRIGLSSALSFVRKQGGDIQVESEVGRGTEFVVRLPVR